MKKTMLIFMVLVMGSHSALAAIKTEDVMYKHGDVELQGYLAYDSAVKGIRPGVLVVHDWNGLDDYEKQRTRQLAELGYVAFALDMYGKGVRPENRQESAAESGKYRKDRTLMRARARAGLDRLKREAGVDKGRVAAIGYCFGGGVVLELARSGADVNGVVSFHGNLDTPLPAKAGDVNAAVLVLHGGDDPHVKPEQIDAFQQEMREAKADWQMIYYSQAVHSFTNPEAGDDPSKGSAYNAKADKRSWEAMKTFFSELF